MHLTTGEINRNYRYFTLCENIQQTRSQFLIIMLTSDRRFQSRIMTNFERCPSMKDTQREATKQLSNQSSSRELIRTSRTTHALCSQLREPDKMLERGVQNLRRPSSAIQEALNIAIDDTLDIASDINQRASNNDTHSNNESQDLAFFGETLIFGSTLESRDLEKRSTRHGKKTEAPNFFEMGLSSEGFPLEDLPPMWQVSTQEPKLKYDKECFHGIKSEPCDQNASPPEPRRKHSLNSVDISLSSEGHGRHRNRSRQTHTSVRKLNGDEQTNGNVKNRSSSRTRSSSRVRRSSSQDRSKGKASQGDRRRARSKSADRGATENSDRPLRRMPKSSTVHKPSRSSSEQAPVRSSANGEVQPRRVQSKSAIELGKLFQDVENVERSAAPPQDVPPAHAERTFSRSPGQHRASLARRRADRAASNEAGSERTKTRPSCDSPPVLPVRSPEVRSRQERSSSIVSRRAMRSRSLLEDHFSGPPLFTQLSKVVKSHVQPSSNSSHSCGPRQQYNVSRKFLEPV